jgi:hypothetical protein
MAEYTNATEFIGSVQLPPSMNTTRLKITIELNTYGVLNVSAVDSAGRYVSYIHFSALTNYAFQFTCYAS